MGITLDPAFAENHYLSIISITPIDARRPAAE